MNHTVCQVPFITALVGEKKLNSASFVEAYQIGQPDLWKFWNKSDPLCNSLVEEMVNSLKLDNLLRGEAKQQSLHESLWLANFAA